MNSARVTLVHTAKLQAGRAQATEPARESATQITPGIVKQALAVGERIGRYVIMRELGAGGMGKAIEIRPAHPTPEYKIAEIVAKDHLARLQGDEYRALLEFEIALEQATYNDSVTPFHPARMERRIEVARSQRRLGYFDAAQARLEDMRAGIVESLGASNHQLSAVLGEMGHVELMRSRASRAAAHYRAAITSFDPRNVHPRALAPLHWGLAQSTALVEGRQAAARDPASTAEVEFEYWPLSGQYVLVQLDRELKAS